MNGVDVDQWASEEFAASELGDTRRSRRLVRMAARAAANPAGRITQVFADSAEREAAFRFVENDAADTAAIGEAAHRGCAARCAEYPYVFVPADGSSLNLTDRQRKKRLGVVGARSIGARGLQVMTAIAVSPEGVPLGICGQVFWARQKRSRGSGKKHDRRRVQQKETRHWLTVMEQTRQSLSSTAPTTQPWFQLDRGGDAWPVILDGLEPGQLFTVRASHDRRLCDAKDEPRHYLWDTVEHAAPLGRYELEVPAGPHRKGRTATMEVRVSEVTLRLSDERTRKVFPATLFAVLAREVSRVPRNEEPIEWLLLTSYEVRTFEDARLVIYGYAQRWRVEEFHRIWKTGACNVEDTQLGDRDRIIRWSTILASVAMRLLRLTYLARKKPELPASVEFDREEIDATILLKKKTGYRRGQMPTIAEMVTWVAELGGYTGKSSGGPPGPIVIGRGLDRIQSLVEFLKSGEM